MVFVAGQNLVKMGLLLCRKVEFQSVKRAVSYPYGRLGDHNHFESDDRSPSKSSSFFIGVRQLSLVLWRRKRQCGRPTVALKARIVAENECKKQVKLSASGYTQRTTKFQWLQLV